MQVPAGGIPQDGPVCREGGRASPLPHAEVVEGDPAAAPHGEHRSGAGPLGSLLHEGDVDAAWVEGGGERQPGDAATDDQDVFASPHAPSLSARPPSRPGEPLRQAGADACLGKESPEPMFNSPPGR